MVFAKRLVGDILSFPKLADSDIVLMDIDEHRLEQTTRIAEALAESSNGDATVTATTDRREALKNADYVLNMINVGGTEPFENEIRIPEKYGVKQAIGDTLGPGGIFRALRTIPTMLDIATDMEQVCPDALLLNYTNPMAMICMALFRESSVETIGLCHSVPHTAEAIADYVGVPQAELDYWVAGINHMAWFLRCEHEGQDLYPDLHRAMTDEEIYEQDTVRFDLLKHFGAFVTESSHHNSEYLPYFRTDSTEIDRLTGIEYAKRMSTGTYLRGWKERSEERDNESVNVDSENIEISRSEEYASRLIHSLETGELRRFNLNVSNQTGAIANLAADACVEVPCFVDQTGIHPCTVGDLPQPLVGLNRTNVNVQQLAVTGALENDREAVHQAVKLDPLTAAELTLDEIHNMTEELIEANQTYIPELN